MQIQYRGSDNFDIKLKDTILKLGSRVSIDDFVLPGPGEYEKRGISVFAIPDDQNIIYTIHAEEMTLCFLGHLSRDLNEEETKQIGNVDILFLPLGAENTIELKKALNILSKIDPRVVIPMLYTDIEEFKKSEGVADGEFDVLKIKKSDLPDEQRALFVLKAC
ncbi:MAG: MBL fold metallo-hydrolase [bacterium]